MKFYEFWRSGSSWRVRLALAFKGVAYQSVQIDLVAGAQRQESYLKINPMGAVPALELDGGELLTESVAIIEWLDETYPKTPRLLPTDALQRAHVRELV